MDMPLVSCIMPTANRQKYLPFAIKYFLDQDYPNAELFIIDDGIVSAQDIIPNHPKIRYEYSPEPLGSIGIKRNYACGAVNGEIIMHWDDDDWYAPDWISRQVNEMIISGADITGLNRVIFYSPHIEKHWVYEDTFTDKPWLCGATMAFKRSLWQAYHFIDIQVGEDYDFVWNSGGKIHAHDYIKGFAALLHAHNTSIKPVENPKHKKHAVAWTGETNPPES